MRRVLGLCAVVSWCSCFSAYAQETEVFGFWSKGSYRLDDPVVGRSTSTWSTIPDPELEQQSSDATLLGAEWRLEKGWRAGLEVHQMAHKWKATPLSTDSVKTRFILVTGKYPWAITPGWDVFASAGIGFIHVDMGDNGFSDEGEGAAVFGGLGTRAFLPETKAAVFAEWRYVRVPGLGSGDMEYNFSGQTFLVGLQYRVH
ncbi:MAG: porin family protein [Gammaproteobacteria bacterium]|nr:porin family protein [Gammaproteobacteria bacterium]